MKETNYDTTKEDKDKLEFILKQKQDNQSITEELVKKLIELIPEHSLGGIDMISITADLAAFSLYVCQRNDKDPEVKDALEDFSIAHSKHTSLITKCAI